MDHAEMRERLEAYGLGVLDAADAETVAQHLQACDECRADLAAIRRVADGLPAALAAASPLRVHPSLKRRVLARVQAPPARRRPLRPALWPIAAAAALLMFAGSTAYAVRLQIEQQDLAVAVRTETLDKLGATLSQRDQLRVLEVLDSNTTVKRPLRPVDPQAAAYRDAYGKLWTRGDDDDVVLMVNRLPQPAPGQRYELLVTSSGRTTDVGPLRVDSDGFAMLLFRGGRNGPSYQRVEVLLDGTPVLEWAGSR